ncbi:flagellar motor switch protein FliM [Rhodothalassium salexigens DSM 2132]|uniref:Flagellar motor switch protein FliM n=1 Tax=Rhodothalassium salexigens DSM 2132 TaxID=1188247 RepID=A0A4R2PRQ3_RHOSA|nr:flagellar motor switch protein FliM [Rhodothalassium salexigens]MBB4210408.1 flagellar motor switch protein FliM [Rhodothalassium salexigens DSM 2132]MBK1640055.1 flagellar motor switch protein FliM [Rhodothalassium salexigens DSM 2132]TCP38572.1 flagellar motor switch protein FliM [Rhodothalassium salexigens DSM 2132]
MAEDDDTPVDEEAMAAEWAAMAEGGAGNEGIDDEAVAAEWEAMAGADEPEDAAMAGGSAPGRVLDQDEIDSLLGFEGDEDEGEVHGIQALINSALVSYERLPMLDIIFDRMVRMMSTSLRNFTSDNIEVSLDNITSVRFGDYLNSIPLPAMLAVFRAEEWDNYGLMTIDSSLIYSIVDVLLGGRRGTAAMRIEGRPYTTIEQSLVERMIAVVLKDLCGAFEPLSPVNFTFDRLETNPRFATIARPPNAAVLVKLRVDMEDRGGRLEILFPYATLEPIRELLLQRFMGEKFGRDSIWETHLATELWSTHVVMEAVLDEQEISLRDIMNLEVGQTLPLNARPTDGVLLRCGDIPLVRGRMGRSGKYMAIKVDETAAQYTRSE